MRRGMLAVVIAACAAWGTALAEPWTDAGSGLRFTVPETWSVSQIPAGELTYAIARGGTAENPQECHFVARPRPATQEASAYRVRLAGREPIEQRTWALMPGAMTPVFRGAEARLLETHIEAETFWPIQFGDYDVASGPVVHAAVQFRPGFEYWGFCLARSGPDQPAAAEQMLRSVAGAGDAALQASIEADEASDKRNRQRRYSDLEDQQRQMRELRERTARATDQGNMAPPIGSGQ